MMWDQVDKLEYERLLVELNKLVSERTTTAIGDRISLRDAVCAYVTAEEVRGTAPAIVLQTVKEILRKAETGADGAADELAELLLEWCADFGGRPPGNGGFLVPLSNNRILPS